jgi:4-hydroxy-4-methyl-2-oxoglutarate aldolase
LTSNRLEAGQLEKLRHLDSTSVANAIEMFDVRLPNTGFTDSSVRCMIEDFPPMVGYAATARVRTSDPPMQGRGYYYQLDWLDHVMSIPSPRILVVEDLDPHPGLGAFIGKVYENILSALGCIGIVTNGAVRSLSEARALNLQMIAGSHSVSHAFAHVVDFGQPVVVGHMEVHPGYLIHGDVHGVQTIPLEIADRIPAVANEMNEQAQEIIRLSHSTEFTMEKLRADVGALEQKRKIMKP